MSKKLFALALILGTAATVLGFTRCVVLEDAYAEY